MNAKDIYLNWARQSMTPFEFALILHAREHDTDKFESLMELWFTELEQALLHGPKGPKYVHPLFRP